MSKACSLDYAGELRRSLNRDKPGWTLELVRCPKHGGYHELTPDGGRMFSLAAEGQESDPARRPLVRFRLLDDGARCFHESRAPSLSAACAYCGATLHAHKDDLGRVKSRSHVAGFLTERCPACHRANAVFPAYGLGGIRVSKLAEGAPAMQGKLG